MIKGRNPNMEILSAAVRQLGSLADEMVFLGGCATPLLMTDPAAPEARVTMDVDVITEVASRSDYYRLSERLRERGFEEDQSEGAPLCRWISGEILLDVMPTEPDILGFSNRWYDTAMETAEKVTLPSGHVIRLVTAPYFIATKIEAFIGRGDSDYMSSHDMEDIIALIDGRKELVAEVVNGDEALKKYLMEKFFSLLKESDFMHSLPGHLPPDEASQARLALLIERIRSIAKG
ncbi:MAG: hypothetical protein OEV42_12405 [Deltaproteobacteria bacterium]|nr:hypothetical protein [Deltaproteobacteria bacterium]